MKEIETTHLLFKPTFLISYVLQTQDKHYVGVPLYSWEKYLISRV